MRNRALLLGVLQFAALGLSTLVILGAGSHASSFASLMVLVAMNTMCVAAVSARTFSLHRSGQTKKAVQLSLLTLPLCLVVLVFASIVLTSIGLTG